MADGPDQKTVLSKNVLQMKFMKRSALRIEKEQNEEESKAVDDEHWVLDLPATEKLESKYVTEPSLVRLQNLQFGRMSYKGFNPEIEKLMKVHKTQVDLTAEENEMDVEDKDMAHRYRSLVGTIPKKRDRNPVEQRQSRSKDIDHKSKKRKFLRPSDDD